MTIQFSCSQCGKQFKVPDHAAGREATCSGCGTKLQIPAPDDAFDDLEELAEDDEPEAKADPPLKYQSRDMMPQDLVDMTAMVDIVFFLLIFFLVTSMAGIASTIAMPPTNAQKSSAQKKAVADFGTDFVKVRIDRDNQIWLDGEEVVSEQDLRVRLKSARDVTNGPTKMLLMSSGEAQHGTVVMVLDAGHDVGMADVRLAVGEEG